MRHEPFTFEESPIVFGTVHGVTDGTTNLQTLGAAQNLLCTLPSLAALKAEPSIAIAASQPPIDRRTRAMVIASKSGGTGSWALAIEFSRDGGSNWEAAALLAQTAIATFGSAGITAVPRALPASFLITHGSTTADTVTWRARVTPGQAAAANVGVTFLLFPDRSGLGDSTNRGKQLT